MSRGACPGIGPDGYMRRLLWPGEGGGSRGVLLTICSSVLAPNVREMGISGVLPELSVEIPARSGLPARHAAFPCVCPSVFVTLFDTRDRTSVPRWLGAACFVDFPPQIANSLTCVIVQRPDDITIYIFYN